MNVIARPVLASEFSVMMTRIGLGSASRIAIGVSGGADSMALASLSRAWAASHGADILALVCDHGLREESAAEADLVAHRLRAMGIAVEILPLGLSRGTAIQERARSARYGAMFQRMREVGRDTLLVGHHLLDQAETVAFRMEKGSGTDGLVGMRPVRQHEDARIARPLLEVDPGRLRATLASRGIPWVEDPSNENEAFARVRIRKSLRANPSRIRDLLATAKAAACNAARDDASAQALSLEADLTWHPGGSASFDLHPLKVSCSGGRLLKTLIRAIGRGEPPSECSVSRLLSSGSGTLSGSTLFTGPKGRHWLAREGGTVAADVTATPWAAWDGRFRLPGSPLSPGLTLGALASDSRLVRDLAPGVPARALAGLPCYRKNSVLVSVPHLGWGEPLPAPRGWKSVFGEAVDEGVFLAAKNSLACPR